MSHSTFTHSYAAVGDYEVNVTAHNLHSNPDYGAVGHAHNHSQVIHVQMPVEEWTTDFDVNDDAPTPWLNDDGDLPFVWSYAGATDPTALPTAPRMFCTWGDGGEAEPNNGDVDFQGDDYDDAAKCATHHLKSQLFKFLHLETRPSLSTGRTRCSTSSRTTATTRSSARCSTRCPSRTSRRRWRFSGRSRTSQ